MSKLKEHLLSTDMSCKAQFLTEEVVCFPVSPSRLKWPKQVNFNVVLLCDLKTISILHKIKQSELGLLPAKIHEHFEFVEVSSLKN